MSEKKVGIRTPGSKHKPVAHAEMQTPNKRSKTDITVRNLEDEEFPEGFTFIDKTHADGADTPYENFVQLSTSRDKADYPIVGQFDDLMQTVYQILGEDLTDEFLEFAVHQEEARLRWLQCTKECARLRAELDQMNTTLLGYTKNLALARKLLDKEMLLRKEAERERDTLEQQMLLARDLLFSDKCRNKLPEDTREKLAFLNNTTSRTHATSASAAQATGRLNTISEVSSAEINSTGSLLSDFSCTRSEDDLDSSALQNRRHFKYHEPDVHEQAPPLKKRRSAGKVVEVNPNDKIVATTTLSVSRDGPITATSVIETVPQGPERGGDDDGDGDGGGAAPATPASIVEQMWLKDKSPRLAGSGGRCGAKKLHNFVSKTIIRPDVCGSCSKRMRFGKIAVRCKDCKGACHVECKDKLSLPCVPQLNTPTHKGVIGYIADHAPRTPPMVPALIVHCVNEIEARGFSEVGIYRVPGSEKDVRALKERLLRGRGTPALDDVDVHVLCGVVKDFLRSLQEPLVTQALWHDFARAAEASDPLDVNPSLYEAIAQLPQPNKDTLAYMMVHLQKLADSGTCKMPVGNLAKVFGPTIVGYSTQEPDPQQMLEETRQQALVMEHLLNVPADFWTSIVSVDSRRATPRGKRAAESPGADSLHRGGFFTPYGIRSAQKIRKERKFFGTPPTK